MYKYYPYLQTHHINNINGSMVKEEDSFLFNLDEYVNQKQYVRIILLNWNEEPLKEIQGELSSGSLNKDGTSSVRATCNFTASINKGIYDLSDSKMDFAINKKIYLEIGIENQTDQYPEYPILWFPQGIFFISTFSMTSNATSAVNISLSLKDKMCGLNGEVGGKFPATVQLDIMDTQDETGAYITQKVKIIDIIQECVHHYGGEDISNIVIEDVPHTIKRVMKWTGSQPLYVTLGTTDGNNATDYTFYTIEELPEDISDGLIMFQNGDDVGYINEDLVYTGELVAAPGEAITSILDKIKQYLGGNFEYFYDEFGVFHFREIKNYLNTTLATNVLSEMSKNDYLVESTTGKTEYSFTDSKNLVSLSINPSYENIKNDYTILGLKQMTSTDISSTVRYHLVIDNKPTIHTYKDLLIYLDESTGTYVATFPYSAQIWASNGYINDLPEFGTYNVIYHAKNNNYFVWNENGYMRITEDEKNTLIGENEEKGYLFKDRAALPLTKTKVWYKEGEDYYYWVSSHFDSISKSDIEQENNPVIQEVESLPQVGKEGQFYKIKDAEKYYEWVSSAYVKVKAENVPDEEDLNDPDLYYIRNGLPADGAFNIVHHVKDGFYSWNGTDFQLVNEPHYYSAEKGYTPKDWRTELYLQGLLANNRGTDAGYAYNQAIEDPYYKTDDWTYSLVKSRKKVDADLYYEELSSFWPLVYNLYEQCFYAEQEYEQVIKRQEETDADGKVTLSSLNGTAYYSNVLTNGTYYLDFIDPATAGLGEFSVANIGRRQQIVQDDNINCLFEPEIPDIIILNVEDDDLEEKRAEAVKLGQKWTQVRGHIFNSLATGGVANAAFEQLKYEVTIHTSYQKTISLTAFPVYYLRPNCRVFVSDRTTNIQGDYFLRSLSIPLGPGQLMTGSASECVEQM